MTSKQRAALRARANGLEAIIQIGKGGISENLIQQVDDTLNVRDLIKIRVLLETAPDSAKAFANELAQATSSDVVQVIGGIIVLFREVKEKPKKVKPKKSVKPGRKGKVVRGLRQRTDDKEAFFAKRSEFRNGGRSDRNKK